MFIVSGPASISNQIEERLIEKGIHCTRLFGQDRYGTSAAVANYLGKSDRVIIASGDKL